MIVFSPLRYQSKIDIFPLPVSKKTHLLISIVGTIGTVDDLIKNLESQKETLKIFRTKLLSDFLEHSGTNESFSAHVFFEGGAQPPKSQHIYEPRLGYVRFIQNRDYSDESHLTFIPKSPRNKICDETDIMMDKYGEAGKVRYGLSGAYNVALMKITPKDPWEKEFIRDFLTQDSIRRTLYASSQASTRPSLNESTFSAIKIPAFPKEKLQLYEEKGEALLKYEILLNKKIHDYKEIKSKLLAKYF